MQTSSSPQSESKFIEFSTKFFSNVFNIGQSEQKLSTTTSVNHFDHQLSQYNFLENKTINLIPLFLMLLLLINMGLDPVSIT